MVTVAITISAMVVGMVLMSKSGIVEMVSLPKKALVTGGAGLFGTHLCKRLLADGYEVTCMDNEFMERNGRDLSSDTRGDVQDRIQEFMKEKKVANVS